MHSPAHNKPPDLGGAPMPTSHGGKLKALPVNSVLSRANYNKLCHNVVTGLDKRTDSVLSINMR